MELPAQIGKYEIIGLIGRGGMGVVYQARDNALGRLVALKVVTSDLALDHEADIRFLREARSVAALQHPNIVVVCELGEHNGSPFIAMEFLDGEPLDRLIRNHVPLTVLQKTDIILQVAKALQYAHDKGVIHRDVKPGNIMRLRDGSVKVVDFGLAHLTDQTITKIGMVMGTLGYLAPEQLNSEGIDGRTDIFSLGVVMYELLSGRLPFEGAKPAEVMKRILLEEPHPLPLKGGVNLLELQHILDKALAKRKDERYQTCSEFAEALTRQCKEFEVAAQEYERKAQLKQLVEQLQRQVPATAKYQQEQPDRAPIIGRDQNDLTAFAEPSKSVAVAPPIPLASANFERRTEEILFGEGRRSLAAEVSAPEKQRSTGDSNWVDWVFWLIVIVLVAGGTYLAR